MGDDRRLHNTAMRRFLTAQGMISEDDEGDDWSDQSDDERSPGQLVPYVRLGHPPQPRPPQQPQPQQPRSTPTRQSDYPWSGVVNRKVEEFDGRTLPVASNNACLFNAVAGFSYFEMTGNVLHQIDSRYETLSGAWLRSSVVRYMRNHGDERFFRRYGDFDDTSTLREQVRGDEKQGYEQYLARLAHPDAWGGNVEVNVIGKLLQRTVLVYQYNPSTLSLKLVEFSEWFDHGSLSPLTLFLTGWGRKRSSHFEILMPSAIRERHHPQAPPSPTFATDDWLRRAQYARSSRAQPQPPASTQPPSQQPQLRIPPQPRAHPSSNPGGQQRQQEGDARLQELRDQLKLQEDLGRSPVHRIPSGSSTLPSPVPPPPHRFTPTSPNTNASVVRYLGQPPARHHHRRHKP